MASIEEKLGRQIAITEDMASIAPASFRWLLKERLGVLLVLLRTREVLNQIPCPHQQWFINKGVKHVTHEVDCTSDKDCKTPCPRCAVLNDTRLMTWLT